MMKECKQFRSFGHQSVITRDRGTTNTKRKTVSLKKLRVKYIQVNSFKLLMKNKSS